MENGASAYLSNVIGIIPPFRYLNAVNPFTVLTSTPPFLANCSLCRHNDLHWHPIEKGVEEKLRSLGFGYRAAYLPGCAREVLARGGIDWLHGLRLTSYREAWTQLCSLAGVGPKVCTWVVRWRFQILVRHFLKSNTTVCAQQNWEGNDVWWVHNEASVPFSLMKNYSCLWKLLLICVGGRVEQWMKTTFCWSWNVNQHGKQTFVVLTLHHSERKKKMSSGRGLILGMCHRIVVPTQIILCYFWKSKLFERSIVCVCYIHM